MHSSDIEDQVNKFWSRSVPFCSDSELRCLSDILAVEI